MKIEKSEELWKKGKKLIINGTSLFSRGPRVSPDCAPIYIKYVNSECYFHDVDDNEFLDYGMAVGSVILGWNALSFNSNNNLSLLSTKQVEMAEIIRKNIPSCQRMKFLSSGSEVTETAVRIARAFTEKDYIIKDEYHGWMSWCAPKTGGVPKCYSDLTIMQPEQDVEKYKEILDEHEVACVILEPMKSHNVTKDERAKFLSDLKRECKKRDTLLVFDEVACGYRFGVGGAQEYFGVRPDVSAFGKSIANGYPFSFVGTSEEIADDIEGKIFVSSTFGGNPRSLEACILTTDYMVKWKVEDHLRRYGFKLKNLINAVSNDYNLLDYIKITGLPNRLAWSCKDWNIRTLLMQEFVKRGIFFTWEIKNAYAHKSKELDDTIIKFEEIVSKYGEDIIAGNSLKYIEGEPMRPIL